MKAAARGAQRPFLALCAGDTLGDSGDPTEISCMQGKLLSMCALWSHRAEISTHSNKEHSFPEHYFDTR